MSNQSIADDLFFTRTDLTEQGAQAALERACAGADDGELFLEYSLSESFSFDDGRLRAASSDTTQGFGLRAIADEATGYAILKDKIHEVLDTLTDREKTVLIQRFGLIDGKPKTLEEVGLMFSVTRERIRQIEAKALRKMRHPTRSKHLKAFLDLIESE